MTHLHTALIVGGGIAGVPVAFKPLQRRNFSLLAGWLAEPLVARWWNHENSPEAIERDFGPSVDGHDATRMFVVVAGDWVPP